MSLCLSLMQPFILISMFCFHWSIIYNILIFQYLIHMQQRDFPFSLFTFLLFLILIYPAIQDTFTKITHNSDISLSCPTTEVIEIGNMRNYVLRLMEAPKEASVSCFGDEAGEVTSECDLDKNKQLCVFRNFVTQLICSCFDETQTLLLRVLEPEEVTELSISE